MRLSWLSVLDGVITGIVLAVLLTLPSFIRSQPVSSSGGWIFLGGLALAIISLPVTVRTGNSPPGVLGLALRHRPAVVPDDRPRWWVDRFVSPRNVWLISGLTLLAISFLPPFLGV
jgi:hypothetical protein